ncbi:MAG: Gfo/Idh/MocA family oxidoreductase [Gemmatimonadales bacterium]|jgi:predicted dehydrogenase|nr:Gfo/Idh/MocA family oxidoreductase [Gemmatimonadales bacterium]
MSPSGSAQRLSVAVVGVGEMGRNHARCLAAMKGVDLVAVMDSDVDRCNEVAATFECRPVTSISDLPHVDAAIVAVPSASHAEVGCALMERGVHCLIEKPLALDRTQARLLVDAADSANVVLQVGHIERFNPAVRQLKELLEGELVLVTNARRMSAVSGRVTDIDVVMDLMVHDLDIMLFLMGDGIDSIEARAVTGPSGPDHVTALLSFQDGRLASLTASRITQNQIRQLEVTTRDRFFTVDYPNQELLIFRQGRIGDVDDSDASEGRYALDVDTRRVFVRRTEPLVAELQHFLGVVRGTHDNEVDGRGALRALDLVWAIQGRLPGSADRS